MTFSIPFVDTVPVVNGRHCLLSLFQLSHPCPFHHRRQFFRRFTTYIIRPILHLRPALLVRFPIVFPPAQLQKVIAPFRNRSFSTHGSLIVHLNSSSSDAENPKVTVTSQHRYLQFCKFVPIAHSSITPHCLQTHSFIYSFTYIHIRAHCQSFICTIHVKHKSIHHVRLYFTCIHPRS